MITIKGIQSENFQDYKKCSFYIAFAKCSFKCEIECGQKCCLNKELAVQPDLSIDSNLLVQTYMNNNLTQAIVIGGLEPFDTPVQLLELIKCFRKVTQDDIVIYSGYYEYEIYTYLNELKRYPNIIVKLGRFIPNRNTVTDSILGVTLASDNQYAIKLS